MEIWGGNHAVDTGVAMPGIDAWVYSRPWRGDKAGGDVHYVSSCASGRIVRMLVADVSGHGENAAETADRLRQLMRRYVNHLDQRKFVADLSRQFGGLSNDGRFATAAVFTYFGPTGTLTISNAGHPPPLIYRAASKQWSFLVPSDKTADSSLANLPLGVIDAPRYDALAAEIAVDDQVLCYTDSLIESSGPDGRMLGAAGLMKIVRSIDARDPSMFISSLLTAIESQAPGNLQGDDVTALLFRANGEAMRYSVRERLSTYRRVLAATGRALAFRERFPWPDMHMANIGGAFIGRLNRKWRGGDSTTR